MKPFHFPVYRFAAQLILFMLATEFSATAQPITLTYPTVGIVPTLSEQVESGYTLVAPKMFEPQSDDASETQDIPQPYTGIPFKITAKYLGLNGEYKIEIRANDTLYLSVTEPYCEFTPVFGRDEGKLFSFRVYYRARSGEAYKLLNRAFATAFAPPMRIRMERLTIEKEEVTLRAYYGTETSGMMMAADSLLVASDDNYFLPVAYRIYEGHRTGGFSVFEEHRYLYDDVRKGHAPGDTPTASYILKPADLGPVKPHRQSIVNVVITDPVTKQTVVRWCTLVGARNGE